jgi:hypothetical protein
VSVSVGVETWDRICISIVCLAGTEFCRNGTCFGEGTFAFTCNAQPNNVIESPLLPANEFVY